MYLGEFLRPKPKENLVNMQEFYTTREAQSVLHLTDETIRKYIREERLTAVRFGKKYLIPHSEIQRLMGAMV